MQVIHTVVLILDTLESRNLVVPSKKKSLQALVPKDKRDKVVEELLMTERKYVHDLELLLDYQTELQTTGALSADTIHYLFPNLNVLIDFQRRFLIGIEYHAQLPPKEQFIGSVFTNFEEGFDVYEGFALNQKKACQIAVAESSKLASLSHMVDPTYELPCYLIKPIQRICKYPLLLRELVKYTPEDWPNYDDQLHALEVIKRVTLNVNETQRRVENLTVVKELSERLMDWKGHNLDDFGALLHDGVFPVIKASAEREYHLYLFENIILCCKEALPTKKTMTLTTKKPKSQKRASLILKGRIYMAFITHVSSSFKGGHLLHIAWGKDASDSGFFDIKFRNDELLEQWESTIKQMVARYNDPNHERLDGSTNNESPNSLTDSTLVNGTSYDDGSDDEMYVQSQTPREPEDGQEHVYSVEDSHMYPYAYQQQLASIQDDLERIRMGSNIPHHVNSNSGNSSTSSINNNHITASNGYPPAMRQESSPSGSSYSPTSSTGGGYTGRSRSTSIPLHSNGMQSFTGPTIGSMAESELETTRIRNTNTTEIAPPPMGYMMPEDGQGTVTNGQSQQGAAAARPKNMKVKLHYLDDSFLLIMPTSVTYSALLERVERKIRLCGKQTPVPLRIKYKDEDDDFVTMHGDEDIAMAMEGTNRDSMDGGASKLPTPDLVIWAA